MGKENEGDSLLSVLTENLGIPAVHYDGKTDTATVLVTVDAAHLGCFLSGVDHLQHQHGPFRIPDALPADIASASEGGD